MGSDRLEQNLARLYHARVDLLSAEQRLRCRALVLFLVAYRLGELLKVSPGPLFASRLAQMAQVSAATFGEEESFLGAELVSVVRDFGGCPGEEERGRAVSAAHHLGRTLDLLLAAEVTTERRKLGSYFTPVAVARRLMSRATAELMRKGFAVGAVCDPACGGGAFLIEAALALLDHPELWRSSEGFAPAPKDPHERALAVVERLHGVDLSPLAVFVTDIALWFFAEDPSAPIEHQGRILVGDALLDSESGVTLPGSEDPSSSDGPLFRRLSPIAPQGFSFAASFPQVAARGGFDWIVGNPPWVAFQGRATQKISPALRAYYRERYEAFAGYPTLHALFVQRAAEIAPRGAVTLLLPSSLSDLSGYQAVRARLRRTHQPKEPLEEFGQDAFAGVVQPCFGLVALARDAPNPATGREEAGAPLSLMERRRSGTDLLAAPPPFLERFARGPFLPKETFGELGFQSNTRVVKELFYRGEHPKADFELPLLEGRNVGEFAQRPPRLFMKVDTELLKETRCRLRSAEAYQGVDFVVRQTAAFTIAAKHQGMAFRNSLIAGYARGELRTELLLALLNSALYRALHCSRQRDARQATFPQVKVAHLRGLPFPPHIDSPEAQELCALGQEGEQRGGLDRAARIQLDALVFRLFGLDQKEQEQLVQYLASVAPAALKPSIAETASEQS